MIPIRDKRLREMCLYGVNIILEMTAPYFEKKDKMANCCLVVVFSPFLSPDEMDLM